MNYNDDCRPDFCITLGSQVLLEFSIFSIMKNMYSHWGPINFKTFPKCIRKRIIIPDYYQNWTTMISFKVNFYLFYILYSIPPSTRVRTLKRIELFSSYKTNDCRARHPVVRWSVSRSLSSSQTITRTWKCMFEHTNNIASTCLINVQRYCPILIGRYN